MPEHDVYLMAYAKARSGKQLDDGDFTDGTGTPRHYSSKEKMAVAIAVQDAAEGNAPRTRSDIFQELERLDS